MFRLSGVLRQPGPERGEGSQWEGRGWGSDLLSVETSGGGRRGSGRGGSGVGPSDCAKGRADRSGDRRDVMPPALQKALSVSWAILRGPYSLNLPFQWHLLSQD